MGWGKAGKPTYKICQGYGRAPHKLRYDDFPTIKVRHSSGKVGTYAGFLCNDCLKAYNREHKRMTNRLQGKATRPQDVPWKKHRRKQDETWVRGINARRTQVDSDPFFKWLERWMHRHGYSLEFVCREVKVSSRTVRRWRTQGHLQLHTAEKFFVYAHMPQMSQVLYPHDEARRAA